MLVKMSATKFQLFKNMIAKAGGPDHYSELHHIKRLLRQSQSAGKPQRFLGKKSQEIRGIAYEAIDRLKEKLGR